MAALALMLVFVQRLDVYAVMLANILFSLVCCVLNIFSMRKYLGYRAELRKTYMEPLLASAIMSLAAYLVYRGVFALTRRPSLGLFAGVIMGVIVYMILYVMISRISEEELRRFPGGNYIVRILKRIHIY